MPKILPHSIIYLIRIMINWWVTPLYYPRYREITLAMGRPGNPHKLHDGSDGNTVMGIWEWELAWGRNDGNTKIMKKRVAMGWEGEG